MAEAKWTGVLSTTESRNDVGIIKVRQGNINSEIAEFQIVQKNKPYDLTGLTVYFCASFGLNLVEKPAVVINTTGGRIQYTFDDDSMQSVGRQKGYFSIKKEESKVDSTQDFEFQVDSSLMTRSIDGKSYIYKLSTLIKVLDDFVKNGQNNFNVWFESVKEILYGVDPGGNILRELIEARKNSSGNIFASLKARLDKNEQDVTAKLAQFDNIIISIDMFPRLAAEISDTPRMHRARDYVFNKGGGTVTFPYGTSYDLKEQLIFKRNVLFKGIDLIPLTDTSNNVTFNCYYGKNDESKSQILLNTASGLKGISFYYPEQVDKDATEPIHYGYTIDIVPTAESDYVDNIYLEKIMLVNSYKGINLDKAGRFNVSEIYGNPIKTGLRIDRVLDVSRAKHIHFWPFKYPSNSNLSKWIKENGTAFEFKGIDQLSAFDLFAFAYHEGFRVGKGFWGDLVSCVADGCINPLVLEDEIDMLRFSGGALATVRYDKNQITTSKNVLGSVSFSGTDFFGASTIGPVISSDTGDFAFAGCNFKESVTRLTNGWKFAPIVVEGEAAVSISGCTGLMGRVVGGYNVKVDGVPNFDKGSLITDLKNKSSWNLSSGATGYVEDTGTGLDLLLVPGASGATRVAYMDLPITQAIKNQQDVMILEFELSSTALSTAQRFSIKACRSDGAQTAEVYSATQTGIQQSTPVKIKVPIYFGFFKDDAVIRVEWQAFSDVSGKITLNEPKLYRAATGKMNNTQLDSKLSDVFLDPYSVGMTTKKRGAYRRIYSDKMPTSGNFSYGDEVINLTRTELGSTGSKYIINGWNCIVSGSPGVWVADRSLTGN